MPLIYKTLFLAISTFETPPSFLWSGKTQSVQVPFSVVNGSGALEIRRVRHRMRFLTIR